MFAHQLQVVEYRHACCVRPSIVKSTNPLWLHISNRCGYTFLYSCTVLFDCACDMDPESAIK